MGRKIAQQKREITSESGHIVRAEHNERNPYFMMCRDTAQDTQLSFEAKGVLCYLLSKPSDWYLNLADIMTQGNIGRDKAYKIVDELIKKGYVIRRQLRNLDGRLCGYEYVVYEQSQRTPNKPEFIPYDEYLQSEHWQKTRKEALRRADYACQLCNATGTLDVHHRTYERLGNERPSDVIVLCRACHAKFHDKEF